MEFMEWSGSITALVGALLIASKKPVIGYILCSASCVVLVAYFFLSDQNGLIVMQGGFLLINMIGFYNWSKVASQSLEGKKKTQTSCV